MENTQRVSVVVPWPQMRRVLMLICVSSATENLGVDYILCNKEISIFGCKFFRSRSFQIQPLLLNMVSQHEVQYAVRIFLLWNDAFIVQKTITLHDLVKH